MCVIQPFVCIYNAYICTNSLNKQLNIISNMVFWLLSWLFVYLHSIFDLCLFWMQNKYGFDFI